MEHNCIFLFGDLNFRVNLDNHVAREAIREKKIAHLLQFEELLQLRHAYEQNVAGINDHLSPEVRDAIMHDEIISNFKEGEITFPPTYKYDVGTHNFDSSRKQRVPSWTDRILYMDDSNKVEQLEYSSVPGVSMSDHKPVIGMFSVVTKKCISAQTNHQLQSEYYQRQRFESIRLDRSAATNGMF